jgi:hypothetical protein
MGKIINISGSRINDSGILKLAEYVKENLPEFTLVIGCKPGIYDVDAILIGRGNIYAIECKNWKGDISGGSYGKWIKDGREFSNPLHQSRNNAAALSGWLKTNVAVKGKTWVDSMVVFTHDDCSLTLELDESSNTSVSVLLLDELKEWVMRRKGSVSSVIENEILNYFTGLNGEEVLIARGTIATNQKSDTADIKEIAIIAGFVISILIALSNRSVIALVFAFIMGFIFFIVLLTGKKTSYNLK